MINKVKEVMKNGGTIEIIDQEYFEDFLRVVVEEFEVDIRDEYVNHGNHGCDFDNKNGLCYIDQWWIALGDTSVDNYSNLLEMLDFIKTHTNIEINILDVNII